MLHSSHPDLHRVETVRLEARQLVVCLIRRHVNQRVLRVGASYAVAQTQAPMTQDVVRDGTVGVEWWVPGNVEGRRVRRDFYILYGLGN